MNPFELSVKPAYGRDYKNKKEILADYLANNDFELTSIFEGQRKINKETCLLMGICCLRVRYGNLRKVASINVVKNRMN